MQYKYFLNMKKIILMATTSAITYNEVGNNEKINIITVGDNQIEFMKLYHLLGITPRESISLINEFAIFEGNNYGEVSSLFSLKLTTNEFKEIILN